MCCAAARRDYDPAHTSVHSCCARLLLSDTSIRLLLTARRLASSLQPQTMALISRLFQLEPITAYYTSDHRQSSLAEGPYHPSLEAIPAQATWTVRFYSPLLHMMLIRFLDFRSDFQERPEGDWSSRIEQERLRFAKLDANVGSTRQGYAAAAVLLVGTSASMSWLEWEQKIRAFQGSFPAVDAPSQDWGRRHAGLLVIKMMKNVHDFYGTLWLDCACSSSRSKAQAHRFRFRLPFSVLVLRS